VSSILENYPLFFTICFVCFLIRTAYNYLSYNNEKIRHNKLILVLVFVSMFFLWLSWFHMNYADPVRFEFPSLIKYSGLILFIFGFLLAVISMITKHGVAEQTFLVKKGIYTKIRNPMYLGFIIWIAGFPFYMGSIITLFSSVIWITHILLWKHFEEKDLLDRFSDYAEYRRNTWF